MATTSLDSAMNAASQLEKIGFVEFTVDLVKGVYETVITASMNQLNNYAELVSKVSKDLAVYQKELIGADGSPERQTSVDSFIKSNLKLDPSSTNDYTLNEEEANVLKVNLSGATLDDNSTTPPTSKTINDLLTASSGTGSYSLKVVDLKSIVEIKLKGTVKQSQDLLKTVLKIGMQKVVITSGEILTKLTFHVDAEESLYKTKEISSQKSSGWGIGGGLTANVGGIGKIIGASVGASLSGGYSNRKLNVSVVNEKSSSATNLQIDILGQVRIQFRTETFPSVDA